MRLFLIGIMAMVLTACGYASRDTEAVGQVKRVMNNTPILCSDFIDVDLSLGVIRNGVGSVSNEDIWIVVSRPDAEILKKANEEGQLVKITYDQQRFAFCTEGRFATKLEILK